METRAFLSVLAVGRPDAASAQATQSGASPTRASEVTLRSTDVLRITVWPSSELSGECVLEGSDLVYPVWITGEVQRPGIYMIVAEGAIFRVREREDLRPYGEASSSESGLVSGGIYSWRDIFVERRS